MQNVIALICIVFGMLLGVYISWQAGLLPWQ